MHSAPEDLAVYTEVIVRASTVAGRMCNAVPVARAIRIQTTLFCYRINDNFREVFNVL